MNNAWSMCFEMEKGKTYKIRFVYVGEDVVKEAEVTYSGVTLGPNTAVVTPMDPSMGAGAISILSIEERRAAGEVR
jgi:hypothetical protein